MRASKVTEYLAGTEILALSEKWSGSGVGCCCEKRESMIVRVRVFVCVEFVMPAKIMLAYLCSGLRKRPSSKTFLL